MLVEKFYTTTDILQKLNIPYHKLDYLFQSRKLKQEEFLQLNNGHRLFVEDDIPKIKEALFRIRYK